MRACLVAHEFSCRYYPFDYRHFRLVLVSAITNINININFVIVDFILIFDVVGGESRPVSPTVTLVTRQTACSTHAARAEVGNTFGRLQRVSRTDPSRTSTRTPW